MPQRYSNDASKSGKVAYMNTRIKRKDVLAAVVKTRTLRKRAEVGITKPSSKQGSNYLTRLPGELRNQIYALALDAESSPSPQILVPRPRNDNKSTTHAGMNLLFLSKEITLEARSILEARATAYIPVLSWPP
jgi:hypothetical protein